VFEASLADRRRFLPFPNCFELFCFHVAVDARGRVLLSQVRRGPNPCAPVHASFEYSTFVHGPQRTRDIARCQVLHSLLTAPQLVVLVSSKASSRSAFCSRQVTAASKVGEPVPDVVLRDTLHVALPLCELLRHPDGGGRAHMDVSERCLEAASGFRCVQVMGHAALETSKEQSSAVK
jgi:hypothetical protein